MLADLGARVIKLEPIAGDPFAHGLWSWCGSLQYRQESIGLNLRGGGPKDRPNLVAGADLFIHNYRPVKPERLGWTTRPYQNAMSVCSTCCATGYGTQGPGKIRPSTHPVPGAALGVCSINSANCRCAAGLCELLDVSRRCFERTAERTPIRPSWWPVRR